MKLLFDENLSPRLVAGLSDIFPGSVHVRDVGLARANDVAIWDYARDHNLTIVSKDADFHHLSFVHGPPPKVIWIRRGNCSTTDIAALLRSNRIGILAFGAEMESGFPEHFLGKYGCGSVTATPASTIPCSRHEPVRRDISRSCQTVP